MLKLEINFTQKKGVIDFKQSLIKLLIYATDINHALVAIRNGSKVRFVTQVILNRVAVTPPLGIIFGI